MDLILYQIFRTILSVSSRIMKHWPIDHQYKYMSTKSKTGTFKTNTGYLDLLTPGTMKLLEATGRKITKDQNAENVPQL